MHGTLEGSCLGHLLTPSQTFHELVQCQKHGLSTLEVAESCGDVNQIYGQMNVQFYHHRGFGTLMNIPVTLSVEVTSRGPITVQEHNRMFLGFLSRLKQRIANT